LLQQGHAGASPISTALCGNAEDAAACSDAARVGERGARRSDRDPAKLIEPTDAAEVLCGAWKKAQGDFAARWPIMIRRSLNSSRKNAYVDRGNVLTDQGKLGEAVAAYDRAHRVEPERRAGLEQSRQHRRVSKIDEAFADLNHAGAGRRSYDAYKNRARVYEDARLGLPKPNTRNCAEAARRHGRVFNARRASSRCRRSNRRFQPCRTARPRVRRFSCCRAIGQEDWDAAIADFNAAMELCLAALFHHASLRRKRGGERPCATTTRPDPQNPEPLVNRAIVKEKLDRLIEAEAISPPRGSSTTSSCWLISPCEHVAPEALQGSDADYGGAIELDPVRLAYAGRGLVHLLEKRQPQADADFARALEIDPRSSRPGCA
jgi:tetratricopeptide (TPR) repeat protein